MHIGRLAEGNQIYLLTGNLAQVKRTWYRASLSDWV
jgi:hypothetical protein